AEEPYEPLRVDPAIEAQQAERLAKLRAERDQQAVDTALAALKKAAEGEDNVLYPMKDALKARATIGEVCNTLRGIWGTYVPADAY
ncbi:methylmalonyl-CoA mutase family protein, partial [Streptomyces albogriseolus]|uniref:methylmalonyl-CoA mutase family protein n=1 Tax=Streptomyces albogriseolus TaxID=1887 RepID=UPI00345F5C6F